MIGCLRKLQGWNLTAIFEEYRRYAGTKARFINEQVWFLLLYIIVVDDFLAVFYTQRFIHKTSECKFAITFKINHLDDSNAKFSSINYFFGRSCYYYSHEDCWFVVVHWAFRHWSGSNSSWPPYVVVKILGASWWRMRLYPIQVASRHWIYRNGEKTYPTFTFSSILL